jgi:hypothetical protein
MSGEEYREPTRTGSGERALEGRKFLRRATQVKAVWTP